MAEDYEEMAKFKTEIAKNGAPEGVMLGTTAIARGRFGQGRVICFSPHPEMTEGLGHMVERAMRWVARPDATSETNAATKKPQATRGSNGVIDRP